MRYRYALPGVLVAVLIVAAILWAWGATASDIEESNEMTLDAYERNAGATSVSDLRIRPSLYMKTGRFGFELSLYPRRDQPLDGNRRIAEELDAAGFKVLNLERLESPDAWYHASFSATTLHGEPNAYQIRACFEELESLEARLTAQGFGEATSWGNDLTVVFDQSAFSGDPLASFLSVLRDGDYPCLGMQEWNVERDSCVELYEDETGVVTELPTEECLGWIAALPVRLPPVDPRRVAAVEQTFASIVNDPRFAECVNTLNVSGGADTYQRAILSCEVTEQLLYDDILQAIRPYGVDEAEVDYHAAEPVRVAIPGCLVDEWMQVFEGLAELYPNLGNASACGIHPILD